MTMNLGTQTGSLMNHIDSKTRDTMPAVGMGATILMWSDRHACTIVSVEKNGKRIGVQRDHAKRTDGNGMSDCQSYEFTPNSEAHVEFFTLRKNGNYVREGDSIKGSPLKIGARSEYYDFSF